jgi:hypothetical protein
MENPAQQATNSSPEGSGDPENEHPMPGQPAPLRSFKDRILRRIRRLMGMRTAGPVPRCSGVTRRGVPCRAPAMSNGYCRMHGGANTARLTNILSSRFAKS